MAVSELEARRPVERAPPNQTLLDLQAEYRACEAALNTLRRAGLTPTSGLMPLIVELKQIQLQAHARRGPGKQPSRYATRPRLRNCKRAGALRRFLLDQYGLEALGGGVLDVAGGQGALAFEMVNLNGIPVTVVDPRPLDLKRLVYKWRRGMYFRTEPLQRYNTAVAASPEVLNASAVHAEWREAAQRAAEQHGGQHRRPAHWRLCWEPVLWEAEGKALEAGLARLQAEAGAMSWTARGLVQRGAEPGRRSGAGGGAGGGEREASGTEGAAEVAAEVEEAAEAEEAEVEETEEAEEAEEAEAEEAEEPEAEQAAPLEAEELRRVLANSSAVVGMHPDGATEAIIDYGLASGKIFACVPCCVYSTAFPSRRDAQGRKVTKYDAFVDYLLAKAPGRIGVATLPFEGKNRVVYSLRPDQAYDPCISCDVQSLE